MKIARLHPISAGAYNVEAVLDLPPGAQPNHVDLADGKYEIAPRTDWPLEGTLYNPHFWRNDAPLDLSIILLTYNEPEVVDLCLRLYARQDHHPHLFEVIIADDGTMGEAGKRLAHIAASAPGRMRVRLFANPRTDPAEVRNCATVANMAIAAARGRVLFIHSGHIIPCRADNVTQLVRFQAVAAGRVRAGLVMLPQAADDKVKAGDTADLEGLFDSRELYYRAASTVLLEHALRVGGYSQCFRWWGGEDEDFESRLRRIGVDVVMRKPTIKMAHLWHPPRSDEHAVTSYNLFKQIDRLGRITAVHDLPRGVDPHRLCPDIDYAPIQARLPHVDIHRILKS